MDFKQYPYIARYTAMLIEVMATQIGSNNLVIDRLGATLGAILITLRTP